MLTVRYNGSERTFAAGHDVVIGRDLRADVRVGHPLISRAHLVVRFDQGRWIAIDNGSLNGLFVNNRRVPVVDIQDGQQLHIGNPDGPALTFEVGRHQGSAGRPPQTTALRVPNMPGGSAPPQAGTHWSSAPSGIGRPEPLHPPSGTQSGYPAGPQSRYQTSGSPQVRPPGGTQQGPQIYRPPTAAQSLPVTLPPTSSRPIGDSASRATSMMKILRPGKAGELPQGAIKIGRANDNDIVIPEVLASRHHATLIVTPTGTEIRDNRRR